MRCNLFSRSSKKGFPLLSGLFWADVFQSAFIVAYLIGCALSTGCTLFKGCALSTVGCYVFHGLHLSTVCTRAMVMHIQPFQGWLLCFPQVAPLYGLRPLLYIFNPSRVGLLCFPWVAPFPRVAPVVMHIQPFQGWFVIKHFIKEYST
jgi:hypothetical protein